MNDGAFAASFGEGVKFSILRLWGEGGGGAGGGGEGAEEGEEEKGRNWYDCY